MADDCVWTFLSIIRARFSLRAKAFGTMQETLPRLFGASQTIWRAFMKTLIIKCGAAGDVVRTTPLLRVLPGEIWWVSESPNDALLPLSAPNLNLILTVAEAQKTVQNGHFDLVISLEDDVQAATLATQTRHDRLVGAFVDNGRVTYTDSSEPWFGMGLLSKRGRDWADEAKRRNTKTYQEILFAMLGESFGGEEYWIRDSVIAAIPGVVGVEKRAGDRWPTKRWHGYDELADRLRQHGYEIQFLGSRPTIADYTDDIARCEHLVCGDTLAMHLALALGRSVTAIFTCTPPQEIYDYGRMTKVASPMVNDILYRKDYIKEAVERVTVDEVYAAVLARLAAANNTGSPSIAARESSAGNRAA
jgi:heptosyltransferase-2